MSVKLPTDEWLCKKMDKLNVTLVEGYPSRASEAGGLQKDQFVKVGRSQSKWYGLHPNQEKSVESVTFWSSEPAKLNSSYSRVARSSGLSTPAPASRPISQDTLRRWERSAWESTYICNQAAGFSRCLSKVQSSMQTQLKLIQMEQSKGKSSERTGTATDELQYLLKFNSSITKCMAKTMEHLSEFVFINVANMTLARRDAYLAHVKVGIKHDTLSALRQAPIHLDKLFPEQMLKKAEEDIAQHENKNRPSQSSTALGKTVSTLIRGMIKPGIKNLENRPGRLLVVSSRKRRARIPIFPRVRPRANLTINDNHSPKLLFSKGLARSSQTLIVNQYPQAGPGTMNHQALNSVNLNVVFPVPFAVGQPQKKGISPVIVKQEQKLKFVNNASCVDHLCSLKNASNVPLAVPNLIVGARLNQFWETWQTMGAGPKVVLMLKEGYILPFQTRPNLARSPTVVSCYVNPHRNSYLLEALHQLTKKNAIELVTNHHSLGFYNRLFLVPKPNNKWRPILDMSNLNKFLKIEKFKMETPETIQTSLQTGEWVTSIDFRDAYFHIPIHPQSRKYLRFHVGGKTFQFKALPFGLSTAPLEFTVVAKEVKLMALRKGIRIHQYLDDWLVRATSHQTCL